MIYSRSRLVTLCLLIALLARSAAGAAESPNEPADPHQTEATSGHATAPADTHEAVPTAPNPVQETSPQQPAAQIAAADKAPDKPEPAAETNSAPATEPSITAHEGSVPVSAEQSTAHPDDNGRDSEEIKTQIASLLKLGLSLTERSDWDAAEIAFRQVLAKPQSKPEDLANALIGLARVYRRQGSLTKAAAIYERFIKDYPLNDQVPDALLELGRTHRALGANQLAISRFYSVINSTLKVSGEGFIHYQVLAKTAQFEIAETHFEQGNFAEANKFFSRLRLLDLAPVDRARAHFKSAYALYLDKNLEDAVTNLKTFIEQWPEDENVPEARNLLALALRTLGRKQEALDVTIQLLRSQQGAADARRWSYWQRRTGNQLANDFFQSGDTLNALAIYKGLAALAADPAWRLPITYQVALCYERLRDGQNATAAYQTIIDVAAADQTGGLPTDLKELARMSKWRQEQLQWQGQTDRELGDLFNIGAIKTPPTVTGKGTTASTAHDNPGNSAKAPSNL